MKEILMELVIESGSLFSAGLVPKKKMFDTHERAAGKEKSHLLFLLIFSPRQHFLKREFFPLVKWDVGRAWVDRTGNKTAATAGQLESSWHVTFSDSIQRANIDCMDREKREGIWRI